MQHKPKDSETGGASCGGVTPRDDVPERVSEKSSEANISAARRDDPPSQTLSKDKRDVILEFHSSPDAILNALHQAGWQIIPRHSGQAVGRQQEWTTRLDHNDTDYGWIICGEQKISHRMSLFDLDGIINAHNAAFTAECKNSTRLACELSTAKTELAAERQRREQAERLFEQRLLHQHDVEVRKPLVEALKRARGVIGRETRNDQALAEIDAALAQCKSL